MNSCKRFVARLRRFKMGLTGRQKETSQRNNYKALFCKNSLDPYFMTSFESVLPVSGLALHKNRIWDIVKRKKLELFLTEKNNFLKSQLRWNWWYFSSQVTPSDKIFSKHNLLSVSKKKNYFKSWQSQNLRERLK